MMYRIVQEDDGNIDVECSYLHFINGTCYITGQLGEFRIKTTTFIVFHQENCAFIIFISFFSEVTNFRNRILTNQNPELVIRNCQCNCVQVEVQDNSLTAIQGLTSISSHPYVLIVPQILVKEVV